MLLSATIASTFDPPEGQAPYDYVFDLTGEIRHDRTEMVSAVSLLIFYPLIIVKIGPN